MYSILGQHKVSLLFSLTHSSLSTCVTSKYLFCWMMMTFAKSKYQKYNTSCGSKSYQQKNITLQQQKKISSTFRATCYSRCLLAIAGPCNVARSITKLRNCEYVHMLMLYEVIFLKNIFSSSLYYCLHTTSLYFI